MPVAPPASQSVQSVAKDRGAALYLQVFANRRIAAMLLLGFASGLPLALSAGALQAWLTVAGVDIKSIGFFSLVGLPYTFKFVWAPLMDRFEPTWLGRRRGWLLLTQLGLALTCLALAQFDPASALTTIGALAVVLAFLSASQDIVFDAYRTDLLDVDQRGAGAAVSVLGYRLAMLVSGGLALIAADQWLGWPATYRAMAVLFVACAVGTLLLPPRVAPAGGPRAAVAVELRGFIALLITGAVVWVLLHRLKATDWLMPWYGNRWNALLFDTLSLIVAFAAAIFAARAVGFPSFVKPWDEFFSRRRALALLALIVLYKLGDAFAGALSTTFLIRGVGFTQTEVGAVNKVWGLIATIIGALFGGALLARISLYRALIWFGIAQAVSNFAYLILAITSKSLVTMTAAIAIENICGGMGTAAFVALLMALTNVQFSAAQYALLSALAAVGRVYVGPTAGVMVDAFGWPVFFVWSVVAALPGLVLLWWLRDDVEAAAARPRADR